MVPGLALDDNMGHMAEDAVPAEMTQEEALRQAAALVARALQETEARCGVLAQFINDCAARGAKTPAWTEAVIELDALHSRRAGLKRRQDLIQEALDCKVGERPAPVPLQAAPEQAVRRTQRQIQVRPRRR
jgi:hypothetical protein